MSAKFDLVNAAAHVLKTQFPEGLNLEDEIAVVDFRLALLKHNENLKIPATNARLRAIVAGAGVLVGDKVYPDESPEQTLGRIVAQRVRNDAERRTLCEKINEFLEKSYGEANTLKNLAAELTESTKTEWSPQLLRKFLLDRHAESPGVPSPDGAKYVLSTSSPNLASGAIVLSCRYASFEEALVANLVLDDQTYDFDTLYDWCVDEGWLTGRERKERVQKLLGDVTEKAEAQILAGRERRASNALLHWIANSPLAVAQLYDRLVEILDTWSDKTGLGDEVASMLGALPDVCIQQGALPKESQVWTPSLLEFFYGKTGKDAAAKNLSLLRLVPDSELFFLSTAHSGFHEALVASFADDGDLWTLEEFHDWCVNSRLLSGDEDFDAVVAPKLNAILDEAAERLHVARPDAEGAEPEAADDESAEPEAEEVQEDAAQETEPAEESNNAISEVVSIADTYENKKALVYIWSGYQPNLLKGWATKAFEILSEEYPQGEQLASARTVLHFRGKLAKVAGNVSQTITQQEIRDFARTVANIDALRDAVVKAREEAPEERRQKTDPKLEEIYEAQKKESQDAQEAQDAVVPAEPVEIQPADAANAPSGLSDDNAWLREQFTSLLNPDFNIVFLGVFKTRHEIKLRQLNIADRAQLRDRLVSILPDYYVAMKYVAKQETPNEEELIRLDIRNHWGNTETVSFDQLYSRLYVPSAKLKDVLYRYNRDFRPFGNTYRILNRTRPAATEPTPVRLPDASAAPESFAAPESGIVPTSVPEPEPTPDAPASAAESAPVAEPTSVATPAPMPAATPSAPVRTRPQLNADVEELILNYFSAKFKLKSYTQMENLREHAREEGRQSVLDATDAQIQFAIECEGILIDGKVYFISRDERAAIVRKAHAILEEGWRVVYFEPFRDSFGADLPDFVGASHIATILRRALNDSHLRVDDDKFYFADSAYDAKVAEARLVEREILRVWGDEKVADRERLLEKLVWIPEEKFAMTLSHAEVVIRNNRDSFARLDRFVFSPETHEAVVKAAAEGIRERGFVSIQKLPIGNSDVLNEEMSEEGIRMALYEKILSFRYDRKRRIIAPKGQKIDDIDAICAECADAGQSFTLNEIVEVVKEVKGEEVSAAAMRIAALQAGYKGLVRVDYDEFAPESELDFHVDELDARLDEMFNGRDFVPVKGFTSFHGLAPCGRSWNLFLLEAYVYRFSKTFVLMTNQNQVNLNNIGAVVRKKLALASYDDLLVEAVARAQREENLRVDKENVGAWLVNQGYMERVSMKIDRVVQEVKKRW